MRHLKPRYNIRLKDNKSSLSIKVTTRHPWPSILATRQIVKDGSRYFGPFASAMAARETIDIIEKHFLLRNCTDANFKNRSRPCLQHQINRCPAPCVLPVSEDEYGEHVRQAILFIEGRCQELIAELQQKMGEKAAALEYEAAAKIRDQIQAVEKTLEKQRMVSHWGNDQDIFGLYREGGFIEVQVLLVRHGKMTGSQCYALEDLEFPDEEIVGELLAQFYQGNRFIPLGSVKSNGEGVVIPYQTAKGTDIFALGIPNIHLNSDWDLGPTWCYLIVGRETSLIDTGRFGNYAVFESILKSIGKVFSDIERIIITHSHEDLDGNLVEIFPSVRGELWAHSIYRQMISYHSHIHDGARHPEHPGSCRLCIMPEKFYTTCMEYQRRRSLLDIDVVIDGDQRQLGDSLSFVFTPGHSPDALSVVLEDEVIFTGDTVLPDITPHPTLSSSFEVNRRILPDSYRYENTVYGLMNYMKSQHKLASLTPQPIAVFPGQRLLHNGELNLIDSLRGRAKVYLCFE